MKETNCPPCNIELSYLPRYSNLLCGDCASKAIDDANNPVAFYNESLTGGIIATHSTAEGEKTNGNMKCLVDGRECRGIELRFGVTAVQLLE